MADDVIFVEDLRIEAHVGVTESERSSLQPLRLSFRVYEDLSVVEETGRLEDTVDYYRLSRWIRDLVAGQEWKLLETLALEICRSCLDEFGLKKLELTVEKPRALEQSSAAGVTVTRSAESLG